MRLRLGVGYDWNPIPSATLRPIIPDSNRFLVSGGLSVNLPARFVLEGALMGIVWEDRVSTLPEFPAQYSTFAVLLGVSISCPRSRSASLQPSRYASR